jgi:hypothetical protein
MPTRIVREGIISSDPVNNLSDRAEVFYRRLMSVADDWGRFHANPVLLRAYCYPLRLESVCESDISAMLNECISQGLISIYNDRKCLQIWNFGQQRRGESKFPQPTESELLIKCKSDDIKFPSKRFSAPSSHTSPTSSSHPTTHTHTNGKIIPRDRWKIHAARQELKERIREVRIQGGQTHDGQRWEGKLQSPYKEKLEKFRAEDRALQEEYDQAPP